MNKMLWNGLPVIIFGSGGISKEIYSLIKYINSYSSSPIYNFIGFMYIISRLFCKNGNSNKSKNASVRLLFFHSLSAMFT